MFYRLTHLNAQALPVEIAIHGALYELTDGGILLERRPTAPGSDGHARLSLTWRRKTPGPGGILAGSMESYRWTAATALEMSRTPGGDSDFHLTASTDSTRNRLSACIVASSLPENATYTFAAQPSGPIPRGWRNTLYVGGALVGVTGRSRIGAGLRVWLLRLIYWSTVPVRRRRARQRLRRVWKAPA